MGGEGMTSTVSGAPYQDASLTVEQRVADLLSRMTLAEKAAQMMCVWQQKADTLVYSIEFSDATYYGGFGEGGVGKRALMKLAGETGGGYFEVSKKVTIEQIYSTIEHELRNQYSIGYVSDKPCTVSEFRKIQLTTRQKGQVVQARSEYWARP